MNRIVMLHEGTRELNPMEYNDQYLLLKNTAFHNSITKKHGMDAFAYASHCFMLRKCRRAFISLHNVQ